MKPMNKPFLISEKIINSIIENEDYIVKQVEYAFCTNINELFKKYWFD